MQSSGSRFSRPKTSHARVKMFDIASSTKNSIGPFGQAFKLLLAIKHSGGESMRLKMRRHAIRGL